MMKLLVSCALLLGFMIELSAQTPQWSWVNHITGSGWYDWAIANTTDSQGSQYVTGSFSGTSVFGATTLTSQGLDDVFVLKLDMAGNILWAVQAGGADYDIAFSVKTDSAANVYIAGTFINTAVFGSTTLTSVASKDVFVAKLDTDGNFLWAVQGGGAGEEACFGLALDSEANIYVTGRFWDTAVFGNAMLTSNGHHDIYIAKLDSDGTYQWVVSAGGIYWDEGRGISVDADDNIFLAGNFSYTATFGALSLTAMDGFDVFAARLDPDGNFIWVWRAGGDDVDKAGGVVASPDGNVYFTGHFAGTAGFGTMSFASWGSTDIFLVKLDSDGGFIWAVRAGGAVYDEAYSIAADNDGNVYLAGDFGDMAWFGDITFYCPGVYNAFAAKADANGLFSWAVHSSGIYYSQACGITVDTANNVYVTGRFAGETQIGPFTYDSEGDSWFDVFIGRIVQVVPANDELTPALSGLSRLSDAYPNPVQAGETAIIKANIASGESGMLSILNLRGQCVAGYQLSSGDQQINLRTTNLPPGIYFYQLKTPSVNISKKIVLLK